MTESVNGGEINLIGWLFKEISEIKDADEIFEALKEHHLSFDGILFSRRRRLLGFRSLFCL